MLMLISVIGIWGMRCSGPRLSRVRLASFCLGTSLEHVPWPAWWSAYWESRVRGTSLHPPTLMHVGQCSLRSKLDPDRVQSVRQLPALMLPRMHGVVMTLTFGSTACSSRQMMFLTLKQNLISVWMLAVWTLAWTLVQHVWYLGSGWNGNTFF